MTKESISLTDQVDSFGGYLRSIRSLRGLRVAEMAALAGVPESRWDQWESNSQTPTSKELEELVERLEFSPYKHDQLACLLKRVPRKTLYDLCNSRLSALAAHGKALVDPKLEWERLGRQLKIKLGSWAQGKNLELPRDLLTFVASLKTDEEIESWIDEVLEDDNDF